MKRLPYVSLRSSIVSIQNINITGGAILTEMLLQFHPDLMRSNFDTYLIYHCDVVTPTSM